MNDHIVKAFDEEIKGLNQRIADMAGLCEDQLARATDAFRNLDKELAVAVDLRHLLSAMRIASKIERIADYAANIGRQVTELSQAPAREAADLIIDMAEICRTMLKDAVDAFLEMDTDKAEAVWKRDDEVDRKFARMMRFVRRQMQDEANAIADGTQLIFIGRFCERIGDHITNISEDIYYTKTGQSYIGSFDLT